MARQNDIDSWIRKRNVAGVLQVVSGLLAAYNVIACFALDRYATNRIWQVVLLLGWSTFHSATAYSLGIAATLADKEVERLRK